MREFTCGDFIEEDQKKRTRKLWMRLGVLFYISEKEERVILGDDNVQASDVLRRIVREGRFAPDGDSYIPEATVEQYNEENCCAYEVREIGFDA